MPSMLLAYNYYVKSKNITQLQKYVAQFHDVKGYYNGDYYPLSPYISDEQGWMAWQYHDPKLQAGMIQSFRRAKAADESLVVKPQGLDPNMKYKIYDIDAPDEVSVFTGRELMEHGYTITAEKVLAADIYIYSKK